MLTYDFIVHDYDDSKIDYVQIVTNMTLYTMEIEQPTFESLKDHILNRVEVYHMDNGDAWSYFESKYPIYDCWLSGWMVKGRATGKALDPGPHMLSHDECTGISLTHLGHIIPNTVGELARAYEHVSIWCYRINRFIPSFGPSETIDIFDSQNSTSKIDL